MAGIQGERLAEPLDRIGDVPRIEKRESKPAPDKRVIGSQAGRLAVTGDGVAEISLAGEDFGEAQVNIRILFCGLDCLAQQTHPLIGLARLAHQEAK